MDQAELLRYVVGTLESQGIDYCIVGSMASAVYGEPRFTLDIDIVVHLVRGQVDALCAAFPADDFYVALAAARTAVASRGQFNVIHPASGNKVDFMVAREDAWSRSQIARRIRKPILPDLEAYVAAPEDVILGKLWYYREGGSDKHLRDIAAMLQVSGDEMDRGYIEQWTSQLGLAAPWQAVLERLG